MEVAGDDVMLTMSEIPLPVGPLDEGPARFTGSRRGDRVVAARLPPFGGMACPGDGRVTRQTAGTLTATITGDEIAGELTEIFGSGSDQITFGSRFRATLPE
jgi:hypothetical protein